MAKRWLAWSPSLFSLFKVRLPESHVRVGTGLAAAFNLFGIPVELIIFHDNRFVPQWPDYVSMLIGAGILLFLALDNKHLRTKWLPSLFVVNAAAVSMAVYVVYSYVWYSDQHLTPFQETKLAAIIVGVFAPSLLSGLLALAIHVGSSAFQFSHYPAEIRSAVGGSEPWATLAFGLAGAFIVFYRMRIRQVNQKAEEARLQTEHIRRVAQIFLQLRDLMNTPLQSIELGIGLLEKPTPDQQSILKQLRSSCDQLHKLNQMLKQYEGKIEWQDDLGNLP